MGPFVAAPGTPANPSLTHAGCPRATSHPADANGRRTSMKEKSAVPSASTVLLPTHPFLFSPRPLGRRSTSMKRPPASLK